MSRQKIFNLITVSITTFISAVAFARPDITIYYSTPVKPFGIKSIENGKIVVNPIVRATFRDFKSAQNAYETIKLTTEFFENKFGLQSYDGKNAPVKAVVNLARLTFFPGLKALKQNAAWFNEGQMFLLGAGGKILNGFEKQVDVLAHEYTHAVIDNSSKLNYVGQSGALNESFADIFGEMTEQLSGRSTKKWIIGEKVLTERAKAYLKQELKRDVQGLRDMLNPGLSMEPQPYHMDNIPAALGANCKPTEENDQCGVHVLNGIPNRAAALMVELVGWEKMAPLFFEVMTQRLRPDADFQDFANEMIIICDQKLSTQDCENVQHSLKSVGLR